MSERARVLAVVLALVILGVGTTVGVLRWVLERIMSTRSLISGIFWILLSRIWIYFP